MKSFHVETSDPMTMARQKWMIIRPRTPNEGLVLHLKAVISRLHHHNSIRIKGIQHLDTSDVPKLPRKVHLEISLPDASMWKEMLASVNRLDKAQWTVQVIVPVDSHQSLDQDYIESLDTHVQVYSEVTNENEDVTVTQYGCRTF